MKSLLPLFLGIFGTFAFSWFGLVFVPDIQIGHLDPQMEEDGTDVYPAPQSGMAERGRHIYVANGCVYCHSQQIRADYAASDIDRKWGDRRSAPRDYIFSRPVLLGKMRMGPDLANVGHRAPVADESAPAPAATAATVAGSAAPATASPVPNAAASPGAAVPANATASVAAPAPAASASPTISPAPASGTTSAPPSVAQGATPAASPPAAGEVTMAANGALLPYSAAWHHRHLYDPRSITLDSNMPSYRFLYETRRVGGEVSTEALNFADAPEDAPPRGWEVVPTDDAKCLVSYLMSLDQSHALKEVKASAPASPAAPGKQVK